MFKSIASLRRALGFSREAAEPSTAGIDEAVTPFAVSTLVRELELKEDQRPVREHPRWRVPQVVTVMGASPERLAWLQSAAPAAKLVSQRWDQPAASDARDADCLIGWCTESFAARAPNLRWIHLGAAGVEDVLAIPGLLDRELIITNLKRVSGPAIAQHVFGLILCLCRCLPAHLRNQEKRRWLPHAVAPSQLRSLDGKTVLVVGMGGIGTNVARVAHSLGMRVVATRRSNSGITSEYVEQVATPDELIDLAGHADFIVNCLPLTNATRGLFDARFFSSVKRGAIFVNVGRGATVVTDDLTDALRRGQLGGVGLDVTDPEPLPRSHPLWRMPNVVITPHIAGKSDDLDDRAWLIAHENLRRYSTGECMLSVVDRSSGY